MPMITLDVVYTNKNYSVVVLDEPIIDPRGESAPLNYGMYNRTTDVMESYSTYLPGAIQAVVELSEKLEDLMPDDENVVVFTPEVVEK